MSIEHVITVLRRGSRRRENGRIKRFGRPEYLARRLRESTAPFFVSFWGSLVTPDDGVLSHDFSYEDYGDWRWLRPNDIVFVVVLSDDGVSVSEGFQTLVSGDCAIYWKRWKAGDPTTVEFSVSGVGSQGIVRVMVLRNAANKGNPFSATAKVSGTGRVVTIPSVKVGADDLRIYTWFQGGAIPGSPLTSPSVPFVPGSPDLEYGDEFFTENASVTNIGPVGVVKYSRALEAPEFYKGVLTESGPWTGVSVAVKPQKPLGRVLAGPHADTFDFFVPYNPLIIAGDIVVTYVVTDSSSIAVPEIFGDGWQLMDGFPVQNGSKYLHVYWTRKTDNVAYDIDYSSLGFMRLLTVARGARGNGSPFGAIATTTGAGTSVSGAQITAKKDELVFFATVASTFTGGGAAALGPITPQGVSEFEVDADSDSVSFYNWQYRTSSGYALGGPVGPFAANFNKPAAELWTVTFTVLK